MHLALPSSSCVTLAKFKALLQALVSSPTKRGHRPQGPEVSCLVVTVINCRWIKGGELAPPCPPYPRKTHRAGLWERAHGTVRRPLPTPFPQASPHFAQRDDRKVTFFPSLHSYLFLGLLWTEKCIKVQGQDSLPCPSTYR